MQGDCTCSTDTKEPCPVHDVVAEPVATDPEPYAGPLAEAYGIAEQHAGERETRLGIVSRALLGSRPLGERWGLLVRPGHWLEDTCAIQRNAYDLEPDGVPYLKEQGFSAIIELAELIQSLPWKAARDGLPQREPTEQEMQHAREELLDVIIFCGNLAVALGYDDDELWQAINGRACRNVTKRSGLGKAAG